MLRAKASTYGLLAVYEIAKESSGNNRANGVRASDITKKYRLPKAYTAKILSQLAHTGILNSDRGPHGGFRLSRSPEDITLFDILHGVGGIAEDSPENGLPALPAGIDQVLRKASEAANQRVRDVYQKTTVADMIRAN